MRDSTITPPALVASVAPVDTAWPAGAAWRIDVTSPDRPHVPALSIILPRLLSSHQKPGGYVAQAAQAQGILGTYIPAPSIDHALTCVTLGRGSHLTLTLTLTLPLHLHRSPLTAHHSPFTLTLTHSDRNPDPHPSSDLTLTL